MREVKNLRHKNAKAALHLKRKIRVGLKIEGTPVRPRLSVFRSAKHIYVQAIDDVTGVTLASSSTLEKDVVAQVSSLKKVEAAHLVGSQVGKKLLEKGISSVVFDRNGFRYAGRVSHVANGAREAGMQF